MGNKVVVRKNGQEEVFENVLGHQVGYSHIQVLLRDGSQRIISSFDDIDITLDEDGVKKFEDELESMENPPEEAANDSPSLVEPPQIGGPANTASVTKLPTKKS